MSTDFCEECTREAIEKYGWPEVFNTDQGCQYTSEQFTGIFNWEGCPARLSMDGKGRAYDNIFRGTVLEDPQIRGRLSEGLRDRRGVQKGTGFVYMQI